MNEESIVINGTTFRYNPNELKMGNEMQEFLKNTDWGKEQDSFFIYIDPSVGFVIY